MVAMFSAWRSRSTRVVSTALLTQWRRDVLSRCTYTMDNGGGLSGLSGGSGVVGVVVVGEVPRRFHIFSKRRRTAVFSKT